MPKKKTVLGLDLGRYAVKAVWAEKRGRDTRVTRTELLRLPPDTVDRQAVIAPWAEKLGLGRYPCVLGVSGQQAMFQPLVLPAGDPRSLKQAADMEVVKFNEMASEQMVYAFSPIVMNPVERRLILAMARPTVLQQGLQTAREMGIDVVDLVPSPVAAFNAVWENGGDNGSTMVVNVGHAATDVAIGSQAGLLFSRSFAGGGGMFTDALAGDQDISLARADNVKLTSGSLQEGQPTAAALGRAADTWVSEVRSCLSVFESLYPDHKSRPQCALLVGGGSALPGLSERLAHDLSIEARCAESLLGKRGSADAATFAVAAGLALAALDAQPVALSLLPPGVRDELTFRRQKPFWIAAAVTGALILAVSLVGGYRDFRRKAGRLSEQRASLRLRQRLVEGIEDVKLGSSSVESMAARVQRLLHGAPLMRDVITLIAESLSDGDGLAMICDAASYFPEAAPLPAGRRRKRDGSSEDPPEEQSAFERLIIEGYTRTANLSTVKGLIAKLNASPFIASADLLSDDELVKAADSRAAVAFPGAQPFVIDVKVAMP